MKLELKHLAPYSLYGLKVKLFNNIDIITGIDFENGIIETMSNNNCLTKNLKPILRPLSDFNKGLYSEIFKTFNLNWQDSEDFYLTPIDINSVSYELANILIKKHFDIFGLIEKGLAIDINTL